MEIKVRKNHKKNLQTHAHSLSKTGADEQQDQTSEREVFVLFTLKKEREREREKKNVCKEMNKMSVKCLCVKKKYFI